MTIGGVAADAAVLLIVLICIFVGKKRGLVISLFTAFSWLIAIVLAFCLRAPVAAGLRATGLEDTISSKVYEQLEEKAAAGGESLISGSDLAETLPLPGFVNSFLEDQLTNFHQQQAFQRVAGEISDSIASLLLNVLSFLILLVVVFVAMMVVKAALKVVRRLPVVKQADALGGVLFGAVQGVLLVCFAALLLSLFSASDSLGTVLKGVRESYIASFFYEKNFLGSILAKLLG